MVQIGRRVLSIYFKMIIRNRYHANTICFSKNEVSRTPMWTRDFLAPYHNIQIINRRLQQTLYRMKQSGYHNIQIINRRLRSASFGILFAIILTHNSLVRMNIKDTLSYSKNLIGSVVRLSIW